MKKAFTLLIICFLFFKSYALGENDKVVSGAPYAKVRIIYRELIFGAPYFTNDSTVRLCEGNSITLTEQTGGGSYQWYKDGEIMPGEQSNTLTVDEAGKYYVIIDTIHSDTKVVFMSPKPGKPTITFTN